MNLFINNYWFIPDKLRTGLKIKEIRKMKNLTVEDFAFLIERDYKTIYAWEKGTSMPTIDNLALIIEKYKEEYGINITFQELLLPNEKFDMSILDYIEKNASGHISNYLYEELSMKSYFDSSYKYKSNGELEWSFEEADYSKVKFDDNLYPISFHNINKKEILKSNTVKKLYLSIYDWIIQRKLFYYMSAGNKLLFDEFDMGFIINEDNFNNFMYTLENKHGISYRSILTLEMKNAILFDFYKESFDTVNRKYSKGMWSKVYNEMIEAVLSFNDIEYQKSLIDIFPPIVKEVIYNSILLSDIDDLHDLLEILRSYDCKKYRFIDDFTYVGNVNYKNEVFEKCEKRFKQIKRFKEAFIYILNNLKELSYQEYLIERGEANV